MPWIVIVGGLIGGALGSSIVRLLTKRKARRLADDGRLECTLRVVAGRVDGLTEMWRLGVLDLDGTTIRFTRRGPRGPRDIRPDSVPLRLIVGGVRGQRQARVREWWGLSPDHVVLSVDSGEAEVEWALLASQVTWVRTRVGTEET